MRRSAGDQFFHGVDRPVGGAAVRVRFAGEEFDVDLGEGNGKLPVELAVFTRTVLMRYPELITK